MHPRSLTCRAMASVFDAILQAESQLIKDLRTKHVDFPPVFCTKWESTLLCVYLPSSKGFVAVHYLTTICFGKDNTNNLNLLLVFVYISKAQEKDVGVTGNPIALTITWSFAMFPDSQALHRTCFRKLRRFSNITGKVHPNAPALGQMEELRSQHAFSMLARCFEVFLSMVLVEALL